MAKKSLVKHSGLQFNVCLAAFCAFGAEVQYTCYVCQGVVKINRHDGGVTLVGLWLQPKWSAKVFRVFAACGHSMWILKLFRVFDACHVVTASVSSRYSGCLM